jgi:hypothetical protein
MTSRLVSLALAAAACLSLAVTAPAWADDDDGDRFEVTITNLTRGQQFTPILVASHKSSVKLFELGKPASAELATLAEEGNTAPLRAALLALPGTGQVVTGSGLTNPGASATLVVEGRRGFNLLSVAAMLIPTNDAFFALNGVALPRGHDTLTLLAPAYDSGSEGNDELCASIPGPYFVECGGPGGGAAPSGGEEGFVHIHSGIHGVGNLHPAARDWRNPVALITVRRMR